MGSLSPLVLACFVWSLSEILTNGRKENQLEYYLLGMRGTVRSRIIATMVFKWLYLAKFA